MHERRPWLLGAAGWVGGSGYLIGFTVRQHALADFGAWMPWLWLYGPALCLCSSLVLAFRRWSTMGLKAAYCTTAVLGLGWVGLHMHARLSARAHVPAVDAPWLIDLVSHPAGAAAAALGITALGFHAGAGAWLLCCSNVYTQPADRSVSAGKSVSASRGSSSRRLAVACACSWGALLWLASVDALAHLATGTSMVAFPPSDASVSAALRSQANISYDGDLFEA